MPLPAEPDARAVAAAGRILAQFKEYPGIREVRLPLPGAGCVSFFRDDARKGARHLAELVEQHYLSKFTL